MGEKDKPQDIPKAVDILQTSGTLPEKKVGYGFSGRGSVGGLAHVKRPWRMEKNLENGHPFLEQNHLVNPLYLLSRIFLIQPMEIFLSISLI